MPPATPIVGLIDDEPRMLRAMQRLLRLEGFEVRTFTSAEAFLVCPPEEHVHCLVLDVSMPGMSGLELQARLKGAGRSLPIVFLTGQGDIPMSVRAIQAGAINFLTKPVNDTDLLDAVRAALIEAERLQAEENQVAGLRERLARLTPRELEVLRHVIAGKPNKQIAAELGTGEQTIKVHRMRVTEKMGMNSVAELVRAATRLQIAPAE